VWVHDKEQGCIRERGVKKLSTEKHYYSAEAPDGGLDPEPEKVLAGLESHAAPIIKGLRYERGLRSEEEATLAVFMASMKFRVSSYRSYARSHVAANEARIRESAFPSVGALAEGLRRAGHLEAEDPDVVRQIFREVRSGERELGLTKNHDIEHMFRHTRKIAEVLLTLDWTFAWAPSGTSFATSDDPVLVLGPNLEAPEGFVGEMGFASPGATKVLPLNQDVCLVVGLGPHSVSHGLLDRKTVRHLNLQQARHYERWLIARDKALVERLVG
jgi:hypothetical protein